MCRGWLPLATIPALVLLATPPTWPRWSFMWLLATAIYAGCKWLTSRRTLLPAPAWKHIGYLVAWPGLDPVAFLSGRGERPAAVEVVGAAGNMAIGIVLIVFCIPLIPSNWTVPAGWAGMIGIILVLHFGLFHLLSCAWRSLKVDARPLMNRPLASAGVGEFWGRRWNTAFRDFTHRFLFRPLTPLLGPRGALLAGFVFSGLVHDLVISIPAGGGYGGPTLFFLVQPGAMLFERSGVGRRIGLGRGWRGWLFTATVLVGPAGLLFHRPFLENIVCPFLEATRPMA